MDNRDEVKDFLTTRRARLTPSAAGLTAFASNRRVPGLKRGEVADLAGVSVEYYAQLERGNLAGVSDSVLDSLARALQLDEAERTHLADLARAAGPASRARAAGRRPVRSAPACSACSTSSATPSRSSSTTAASTSSPPTPSAAPCSHRCTPHRRRPGSPANHARFTFLDDRARDFWIDWERAADDAVSQLRTEAGRDPYDRALTDLVGELSTRSPPFRTRWAAHDVRLHRTGRKHVRHPVVGELHLDFEVLELPADPGLTLITFTSPGRLARRRRHPDAGQLGSDHYRDRTEHASSVATFRA